MSSAPVNGELAGRVIAITGATGGIGRALCLAAAALGRGAGRRAATHFFTSRRYARGAMGGRRANAARGAALLAAGVAPDALAALHAPIGLFHSSRDPDTLALSTLAEIVKVYQNADFGPALS